MDAGPAGIDFGQDSGLGELSNQLLWPSTGVNETTGLHRWSAMTAMTSMAPESLISEM